MVKSAGDNRSENILKLINSLARGIDNALASNHVPASAPRLPSIVKQVYLHIKDASLHSAITLLMISIKNACRHGWFPRADTDELLQLADELLSSFCMNMAVTNEVSNALSTISKIMTRFLPQLKLNHLITTFEAKPGYDVLMADFHIQKSLSMEQIWLLVAQNDDLQTSSCLVSPPHVSFLINGKGVAGRTNVSLDSGPQFPTDITKMLKYGTNIIQAVGYFNGYHIIAVGSMSKVTSSIGPNLKDHVPILSGSVEDSEIIEGPSRISLNCPISFRTVNTPVKGHLCNHYQCFDYDNFMEMNSRKPSWHCPCCNKPTNFTDLRIDQNMVKILQDVAVDITDVVIYPDGSWRVAVEFNGSTDQPHNGTLAEHKDDKMSVEPTNISNATDDIVDLTMDGARKDITSETDDRKLFQKLPVLDSFPGQPFAHLETSINGIVTNQLENDMTRTWSLASASNASSVSAAILDAHIFETLSPRISSIALNPVISNATLNPVISDATSCALGLESTEFPTSFAVNQQITRQVIGAPVNSMQLTPSSSSSQHRHPVILELGPTFGNGTPSASAIFDELNRYSGDMESLVSRDFDMSQHTNTPCYSTCPSLMVQNASKNSLNAIAGSFANYRRQLSPAQRILQLTRPQSVEPVEPRAGSSMPTADDISRLTLQSKGMQVEGSPALSWAEGPQTKRNWQPTGKMRGSLTGGAFSSALNRYLAPQSQ